MTTLVPIRRHVIGSGFFCEAGVKKFETAFSSATSTITRGYQTGFFSQPLTVHIGLDLPPKRRRGDSPSGGGDPLDSPLRHSERPAECERLGGDQVPIVAQEFVVW